MSLEKKEFERIFPQLFAIRRKDVKVCLDINTSNSYGIEIHTSVQYINIAGKDKNSLLCGIYHFFELCGMHFGFSGEWVLQEELLNNIPVINLAFDPSVKNRGIRMHLNFVQDQSFFTEAEFKAFIENICKMKMNYLLFHMYNGQEWFPFEYGGIKHLELELGNLGRKELSEHMIGREKIKTKKVWFPKEFEDIKKSEDLLPCVYERYGAMMDYAKMRGMKLAASFEPEVVSETFERKILEWSNAPREQQKLNLANDWQEGWSGKKIKEVDSRNPILLDMGVERCLQLSRAYPQLDEIHLISREGTNFQAESFEEYEEELIRIENTFHINITAEIRNALRTKNNDNSEMNAKAYQYWTVLPGEDYLPTFLGAMRYIELALKILSDKRITEMSEKKNVSFVISLYSPNPVTIRLVNFYVGKIIPNNIRFDILGDYGAKDIYEQLDSWKPLLADKKEIGLISWLEFDGNMALGQCWTKSIYQNVKKASEMGIDTIYFNHWRVRSLEQNAKIAAETCFDSTRSYEDVMEAYLKAHYGQAGVQIGKTAYENLEKVTIFCKKYHYNIGFTNDWVYQHATNPPGYAFESLATSIDLYKRTEHCFLLLQHVAGLLGKKHAGYMADICKVSACHLEGVMHLQKAKLPLVGFGCFPITREGNWPQADILLQIMHEGFLALSYEYEYMKIYAKWVETCDEQGQLVNHQLGVIEPFEHHYAVLKSKYEQSVKAQIGGADDGDIL